jgi:hypothetical protein
MEHSLLTNALVYLAAAVVAVPLSKRLGMGTVLGYLAAGILIGPYGLKLIANVEDALHFAEFGVVLLLFLIGLELEPDRLWALRRPIFGWGGAQVAGVTAACSAPRCWRGRLEAGADRRPRAVAVLDRDRPRLAGRTQPDADARRPGRLRDPAVPGHRRDPDDRHRAPARHPRRRRLERQLLARHASRWWACWAA